MHILTEQLNDFNHNSEVNNKEFISRLSGMLSVVVVFLMMFFGTYYLLSPGTLPIKQVKIQGQFTRLLPGELQLIVADKVRGGFFNLNVDAIRNVLIAEPWVSDVTVKRIWSDTIHVTVIEQVALAQWGEVALLNEAGVIFSPDPDSFPDDLPLLTGPVGLEKTLLDKYKEINRALKPLAYEITELSLSERRSWEFKLNNGVQAIIGRTDFNERLRRFIKLVSVGLMGRFADAEYIDLRYPNGFSVKWNQKKRLKLSNGIDKLW